MPKKLDNLAANSTPATSYTERLEQAILWMDYAISAAGVGFGGLSDAVNDLLPELNKSKLVKVKGFTLSPPPSYDELYDDI
ncbi:hypothetical protein NFHSH190041_37080 (plasmid) [Shewanella sp. NFH-SH190041]|uniref:hypothetical protein n=1 Tax=Shewanella sp. NFH-SH190041 TaxID=2950245 RepID=UPI0021C2C2A5|nr:hypothetical protein [Shewanella sp. NFH-SH190041]BDM66256.1 hypothetical protein NFHSH190041_37080 [Shewanella sp. NFH-SH190041]